MPEPTTGGAMKILIPVDGSPCSDAALEFVAARPFRDGDHPQIDLLNVQLPVPPRAGRAVGAEIVRAWHEANSQKVLKPAIDTLWRANMDPAWTYRVGNPGLEIARWADDHGTDLIVMGSHGHTAVKGLLFGSVTEKVLASTAVPVLAIREAKAPRRKSLEVAVALDGSPYGAAAARYVVAHRALFGPRPVFTLLHVAEAADPLEFESVLDPARDQFAAQGIEAAEARLVGNAATEIANYARSAKPDILVMGSHGHGLLTAAFLGSVAWRVAASCRTPLLLVRKP
jgi:nucleotide-binding universal stress UspA family protein